MSVGAVPAWTLGDRMAKSMRSAKVSREAMAEYLDVKPSTVSTWTGDRIIPGKQTLLLWSLRCGVPLAWLQAGENPRPINPGGGNGQDDGPSSGPAAARSS